MEKVVPNIISAALCSVVAVRSGYLMYSVKGLRGVVSGDETRLESHCIARAESHCLARSVICAAE